MVYLVQGARQYQKKAVEILKKIGFTGGDVDPCLYMKQSKKGLIFIALYVDDNLIVSHQKVTNDTIEGMTKHGLLLKVEDQLNENSSCEIKFSDDKKKAWLGQLHLILN